MIFNIFKYFFNKLNLKNIFLLQILNIYFNFYIKFNLMYSDSEEEDDELDGCKSKKLNILGIKIYFPYKTYEK